MKIEAFSDHKLVYKEFSDASNLILKVMFKRTLNLIIK